MKEKIKILQIPVGPMQNFAYLVISDSKSALIDPGFDKEKLLSVIKKEKTVLEYIICTHEHFDHVTEAESIRKETNAKLIFHKKAIIKIKPDILVDDKKELVLGKTKIKFTHTPGHSPGSMCILIEDNLFTGDTLFTDGCGRMDLPGSSEKDMQISLEKIKHLPENIVVWPGHDYGHENQSTIKKQKESNYCLK